MASTPIKVAVIGASGRTGESIIDGLLASETTKFDVTAITRPSSLESEGVQALRARGVRIAALDLRAAPKDELVRAFAGLDVLVSAIYALALEDQVGILDAVKEAKVGRFVPCFFGTPAPRGVQKLLDTKLGVLDAVQRAYVPYTVIDVGWWTQQIIPKVPSGRVDHAWVELLNVIPGDGNVPVAFTDLRDIGKHVGRVIADPRTLNRFVFAYTEVSTVNQAYDLMEELSGEKTVRNYKSKETILSELAASQEAYAKDPADKMALFGIYINQYLHSWGVRGDNAPEVARYLGYLDFHELYPQDAAAGARTFRDLYVDILAGKPSGFNPFKG